MKKFVCLVLVAVMVLSISSFALAASPEVAPTTTGGTTTAAGTNAKPVEVAEASTDGKTALEAAVQEQLKDKVAEGQTLETVATFSCKKGGKVEANAAGVKTGDTVYILFRDANGKIRVIKANVKDGKVLFTAPGAGDFTIVKVAGGAATVPSTGDSNRLMKLVLVGVAAVSVMALAGVAIKRSNG